MSVMKMVRDVIVFDAADLNAESAFWAAIFRGRVVLEETWHSVIDAAGNWRIGVQLAPDHVPPEWPDGAPQQLHLDLHVDDPRAAHAEAVELGARLLQPAVDLDSEEGHQVYADPAGHPFCIGWGHPSATALAAFLGGQRSTVPPVPEHLHTVTPRLVVRGGARAIDFYGAAFAAEEVGGRFTDPSGAVIHAEIRIGDSIVMITDDTADGAPADAPLMASGTVTAIMATYWPDVDAVWERAVAAGAEVIFPLADQFYGERGGRLRDPFGQQWMLSQRIENVSAEEMNRRAVDSGSS